jgi:hypothetical protein
MTPIIRILLRVLAGFLVGKGFTEAQTLAGDPELIALAEAGVGALILAVTEGWYYLAKRFGWKT